MDSETGENGPDCETGEVPAGCKLNEETGESECNYKSPEREETKTLFKIPSGYIKAKNFVPKSHQIVERMETYLANDEMSPAILFLLPTVLFFYPFLATILGLIEVILHTWAHKKNKTLSYKDFYYQSPLHIIGSEFCAACREEKYKNKITKLYIQRKKNRLRKYGIEYVRRIVT